MYVHTYTNAYIHTHTHTHMHAYIHAYIHTRAKITNTHIHGYDVQRWRLVSFLCDEACSSKAVSVIVSECVKERR